MVEFMKPGATKQPKDDDGTERDGYGRYLLPQLDGTMPPRSANGVPMGMTRVSTVKDALKGGSSEGLRIWRDRTMAAGFGQSPELIERAARARQIPNEADRKKELSSVAEAAFDLGGGNARAALGTLVHAYTERQNRGEDPGPLPEGCTERDIQAYNQLLAENHVQTIPGMLERVVKCLYGAAGTMDNMVRWWNPDTQEWELVVADLKTGRDLSLGWLEILVQLWFYANGEGLWVKPQGEQPGYYEPMPADLRRDRALIFHLPMNGTARLEVVDLSGVELYVQAAVTIRRGAKEAIHKVHTAGTVDLRGPAFVGAVPADMSSAPVAVAYPSPQAEADAVLAQQRRETAGIAAKPDAALVLDPPVNPDTGRKVRSCSYCHKPAPGHSAKTCPDNPESPKYVAPVAVQPTMGRMVVTEPDSAPPLVATLMGPGGKPAYDTAGTQFCPMTHGAGWVAGSAPGQFVCGECGKPSEMAERARHERALSPQPAAETVAPPVQTEDWVLNDIRVAKTRTAVGNVRGLAMRRGAWVEELHHHAAIARYYELPEESNQQ